MVNSEMDALRQETQLMQKAVKQLKDAITSLDIQLSSIQAGIELVQALSLQGRLSVPFLRLPPPPALFIVRNWGVLFNSFVLLSFEKMVILEVSMQGAMNMALRPDVKQKIV